MRAKRTLSDKDFQLIGQRYASEDIATETSEASALWGRDVDGLALSGYGPEALADYDALRAKHKEAREARPEAVAAKKKAVQERDKKAALGWGWVDRASGILGRIARADSAVATDLATALPADDSELGDGIAALAGLLSKYKTKVAPSAKVDDLIAEGKTHNDALAAAPGEVANAKAAPIADTAEIDIIDGKLYIETRDLYEAGRSAARNGTVASRASEYTLKHLNQAGRPTAPTDPVKPAEPGNPA